MTTTRNPGTNRARPPEPPKRNEQSGRQPRDGGPARDSGPGRDSGPAVVVGVKKLFAAETPNYFLLLGTTIFLVAFGLVMVLSSSSVESHLENNDFFASFAKQGLFALIGLPLMLVASRMPMSFWKRWAWPAIFVGIGLQLLVFVPGIGWGYGGNQNWIRFGGFTAQPSEVLKLAVIVWIAFILTTKPGVLESGKQLAMTLGPVVGAALGLVLLGQDLGTVIVMALVVYACLFIAGAKLRWLVTSAAIVGSAGIIFAFSGKSRSERIGAWINGCTPEQYEKFCWQPTHGTWALASGGFFGVGLGNSKAKWSWLPEADNDYIFAIIGEELGLIGAIVVLVLFIVLAFSFIRIIRSNSDAFARIVTAGVGIWIVGQAFINIAVVLGVVPVLGVPLPLISAGGSALIATLLATGVVLSFAREPARVASATGGEGLIAQTPAERSRLAASQRTAAPRTPAPRTPTQGTRPQNSQNRPTR